MLTMPSSYAYKHSFIHATFNFLLDFPGIEPKNSFLIFLVLNPTHYITPSSVTNAKWLLQ